MTANPIMQSLFGRKSVRVFADTPVAEAEKNLILDAGIQAPSAGNQQLYTILDIEEAAIKERLAVLCDNQPFIARAPMVLVFLADCERWQDCYRYAGVEARAPGPGDLMLACEDALIAAQNMAAASESLGIGSCYIGDILENREDVTALLRLSPRVFPITMLVFGYPAAGQEARKKPPRPRREYLVRKNVYSPLDEQTLRKMHGEVHPGEDFDSFMAAFCGRKYQSDFAREMNRSTREYLRQFFEP
jgi:nitroreductase/FMN reductase (NADPH)/FMN reductase [NAD(P)H]